MGARARCAKAYPLGREEDQNGPERLKPPANTAFSGVRKYSLLTEVGFVYKLRILL